MEKQNVFDRPFIVILITIALVTMLFSVVFFTVYAQQPDPIEINLITYMGRETINNNNRLAFDLIAWAPGYTDQAIVQIQNNTRDVLEWNINFKNIENVNDSLLESIDVYVKRNPSAGDVLRFYDSTITDGYTYLGRLSEFVADKNITGRLEVNEDLEMSILLHVSELSQIPETKFIFENILNILANSAEYNIDKTFK